MKKRQGVAPSAVLILLLSVGVVLLAGCTHRASPSPQTSGSSTSQSALTTDPKAQSVQAVGNKTALCHFVSRLDSAVNTANTSDEALAAVSPFVAQFDTAVNEAPSDIRPSVEDVVAALRQAVEAGTFDTADASASATGSSAYKLDAYCGIK